MPTYRLCVYGTNLRGTWIKTDELSLNKMCHHPLMELFWNIWQYIWYVSSPQCIWPYAIRLSPSQQENLVVNPATLIHRGWITHICVSKEGHHWYKLWPVAWSTPSHYLNQCWHIINWIFWTKFQWNLNQTTIVFIKNEHETFCKMVIFLSLNMLNDLLFEFQETYKSHTNICFRQT